MVNFCRGLNVFPFHPNFLSINEGLVKPMPEAGIQFFPYNVDSELEFQHLIDTGADGLITDEPLLLKMVLLVSWIPFWLTLPTPFSKGDLREFFRYDSISL